MKNIVINGATSFLGLHLIEQLTKNDVYNIYAIIRENSNKRYKLDKYKNIHIIECDMYNIEKLTELIDVKCDVFFNFAWNETRGKLRLDKDVQEKNYNASVKALLTAKKLNCSKFFSAGSQAEYGFYDNKISEDDNCNPITMYGKVKLDFYNYAIKYCNDNNMSFIEPRFFSIYGPLDYEGTLIISTLRKMINGEEIDFSLATQTWNYLYVKDAINALILLMENNVKSGAYNIGSLDSRELKSFILQMKEITNSKSVLNFGKIPMGDASNVNPNTDKLRNAVQFKEQYTFEKGIKEILDYIEGEL